MAETDPITIHLPASLTADLERLCTLTRRQRDDVIAEALRGHLGRELEIVDGILRGLEDARAGRTVPHEQAMDELDAVIEAAIARKARKSA